MAKTALAWGRAVPETSRRGSGRRVAYACGLPASSAARRASSCCTCADN
ncbi:Uncharacterised protein [Bordetella pertussis]|nr:Uncharacterised protein [Bordetella pertussis]